VHRFFLPLLAVGMSVASFLGGSTQLSAQSAQPMIVRFNENAPFNQYRAQFREDERILANPSAWQYLNRGVVGAVQAWEGALNFRATAVYSSTIKGFAAHLTPEQVAILTQSGWVKSVEADGVMTAFAQSLPWGIDRIDADASSTRAGDGSGSVANVNIYVIDSGVATHQDINLVQHVKYGVGQNTDCNGHGTHVAGTIAAVDNTAYVVGAAPGAAVTGVKVLSCQGTGTTSNIIKGVDWVTANAKFPAVTNMSLGGGASTSLDDAVRRSAAKGIVYAIAAGNETQDACNVSPARAGAGANNGIITVGATDSNNREASFSNFGNCVDIWAPGVSITSTWLNNGTKSLSGTSMASPHVAGVAGLYVSNNPSATPEAVEAQLKADAITTGTTSRDGRGIQLVNAAKY
jgi:aqualysin 1